MERLIFHVDVNSAFLSWEAADRVSKGQDDLRLIPSAIGGERDKRTGVILAKSIPAKNRGVKTGEPVALALRKCPELYLARPNFSLYERCSHAFMDICSEYAPVLEKYSIDECFLDMTGTGKIYPDPVAIAYEIKDRIRSELGFTVNIGISDIKVLAKMASDFEKPDKVHTLFYSEIREKLWPLPVRSLFTVGGSTAERLERMQIKTIGELARHELAFVQSIVGVKMGEQIHSFANGNDESEVVRTPEDAKGYSVSTTLENDVTSHDTAHDILFALTDSVSARMRADGAKTQCVGVTIRDNYFHNKSHQITLPEPTDLTLEIYETGKRLFSELWDGHTPLRLIGLSLTGVTRDEPVQLTMFPDEKKEKGRKVDKTIDDIRSKFGSGTIMRGTSYSTSYDVGKKYKAQLKNKNKEK